MPIRSAALDATVITGQRWHQRRGEIGSVGQNVTATSALGRGFRVERCAARLRFNERAGVARGSLAGRKPPSHFEHGRSADRAPGAECDPDSIACADCYSCAECDLDSLARADSHRFVNSAVGDSNDEPGLNAISLAEPVATAERIAGERVPGL